VKRDIGSNLSGLMYTLSFILNEVAVTPVSGFTVNHCHANKKNGCESSQRVWFSRGERFLMKRTDVPHP
jgi:hypothetical protein